MSDKSCTYRCNICNKNYASINSLWNHNNKYHVTNVVLCGTSNLKTNQKKYSCNICNKYFIDLYNE